MSTVVYSHLVTSDYLLSHGLQHARLLSPWDSPSQNTGVGCCYLLHMSTNFFCPIPKPMQFMGTLFLRTISLKNFFKELVTDLKKKTKLSSIGSQFLFQSYRLNKKLLNVRNKFIEILMQKSIKSEKIILKDLPLIICGSNNFITVMVDGEIIQYFSHCPQCPTLKFLRTFCLGLFSGSQKVKQQSLGHSLHQ